MAGRGLAAAFGLALWSALANAEIRRIEPPNWWLGFSDPSLQLLIYGDDVGHLDATVDAAGVTLREVERTGNPNYLFLHLEIGAAATAGEFRIRFASADAADDARYDVGYRLEARGDPARTRGFSSADAIYLITPDRFANANPANDAVAALGDVLDRGAPLARHGGDLQGIAERLDYIAGLGFTAIWLNPVLENAMPEHSYHGYSTTDFYRVDPRFGTNAELAALAAAARQRGLGLIMDVIVNHCGLHHWWMADLPSADWINQWPSHVNTNHAKTLSIDPYGAAIDRREFIDGWFVPTMPDLNQNNPLMAQYLIQNAIWWIEMLGLAGVRMDTYPYAGKRFMAEWTRRVMAEFPNFNVVGEEWTSNPLIAAYWQAGVKHDGYRSWLPSVMDFPLQIALAPALKDEEAWNTGWITLYESLANDVLYPNPHNLLIFADNHDTTRVFTQLRDEGLFELAMAYLATMRGIPQIYYGTEILMTDGGDHGTIRSDFPGGWPGDAADAVTGRGLSAAALRAQDLVGKLFNWRKETPVIHRGGLTHFLPRDGVYVYFRHLEDSGESDENLVMVVLNKNAAAYTLDLGRFREVLDGPFAGVDVIRGGRFDLAEAIDLEPRAALVLELERQSQ